jgi:hypothetical protein
MNNFTDKEIISWNDRLFEHQLNVFIKPIYDNSSINPNIGYLMNMIAVDPVNNWAKDIYKSERVIIEPRLKYTYNFSIKRSLIDKYNEIINIIKSIPVATNSISNDKSKRTLDTKSLNIKEKVTEHSIYKEDYLLYNIETEGLLGDIMLYIKQIEDAINFLSKKPKFNIHEVVSLLNDRSMDYLIVDYIYNKVLNNYNIDYKITEIISNKSEDVIRYGSTKIINEESLTWSRTSRIDEVIE